MTDRQYTAAAILLHWAIAAAIIANLLFGWWMRDAILVPETQASAVAVYQAHKSLGLSVLVLSLLRLCLRFLYPVPAMPAGMARWQQLSATATHWLFYGLMIGLPLSGWIMVSTQWRDGAPLVVPTLWFGLFEVPHLLGLHEAATTARDATYRSSIVIHEVLAIGAAALLLLHVGAALKHQFKDGDGLLLRMLPTPGQGGSAIRRWSLRGGFAAIFLAALAVGYSLVLTPTAPVPSATVASGDIVAVPGSWAVVPEDSAIEFAGSHAGSPFRGRFTRWRSDVQIDPNDVTASTILVMVETASATDGIKLHDETLPGKEWFAVAQYPTAVYASTNIASLGGNRYRVDGTLTIKDKPLDVPGLELVLEGDSASISGSATIDRIDADLGMDSDPDGSWVSLQIEVDISSRFRAP